MSTGYTVNGIPPSVRLTPAELSRVVTLLGCGCTLAQAIDRIQAERPIALTPVRVKGGPDATAR